MKRGDISRHRIDALVSSYEDFIGVKAVKEAHAGVMMWEEKLSRAQLARRDKQAEIKSLQSRLKEIHAELDRTSRSEDKYLHLLTEEHAAIKKERILLEDFEGLETAEREAFYQLSNRVRASHEREREQAEKTKWWSVSASLIGALIGVAGASLGNELRMRRLREMLPIGGAQMSELARLIGEQNTKVPFCFLRLFALFLDCFRRLCFIAEMRDILRLNSISDEPSHKLHFENVTTEKAVAAIREENAKLSAQMNELTRLARLESSLSVDPNAVVSISF
uniref:Coiled-coil domain-containing protein 51 n=1 Tax=Angiostrongylus cantonensis TaxID=6313 RepID=A0A0K0D5X8_ANGCA